LLIDVTGKAYQTHKPGIAHKRRPNAHII